MRSVLLCIAEDQIAWVVSFCALACAGLLVLACRLRRASRALGEREAALREKTALLTATLDTMDQGLVMIDAHGAVAVANRRASELLGLDPLYLATKPHFTAVRRVQAEAGEYGTSGPAFQAWMAAGNLDAPDFIHERTRPNGTVLEVRNLALPGGGALRTYTDITARKQAELRTKESEERLALALEAGSDGLWDCDLATGEQWSSDQWWRMLGYEPGEMEQHARTWHALVHPDDRPEALRLVSDHIEGRSPLFECEHRLRRKDGGWGWVLTRGKVVARDPADGRALRIVGTHIDIAARKAAEVRIAHLARHDALTDLPNRTLFRERLDQRLAEIGRSGGSCAVLCLDLDRFKEVNDTLGHLAGDALLREVAHRLRAMLRLEDTVARLGGDEFAILLGSAGEGTGEPGGVALLADRLIAAVQMPVAFGPEQQQMDVGVSVGIALAPAHGVDGEAVLKRADLALYRAKAEGRNTARVFEPAMDEAAAELRGLERDLRQAVAEGELSLHYQPQVDAGTGDLIGFEALVRWQHPTRGQISPATFIPLAEQTGLIAAVGEWVLRTACREAAGWANPLKIAVNLSPRQFQQKDLFEAVLAILGETGLPPARLELEITESVIINDMGRALAVLNRLKKRGIRIAMDDFGTGYSSLATLQAFPFDKIKIDRQFVGSMESSPQAAAIVRAILGLGRSLGMGVVAEGVETEEQMRFLVAEACDEVQGYFFGRPQPIEHFAAMVSLDAEVLCDPDRSEADAASLGRSVRTVCAAGWKPASRAA